jgi:hypothetical protein
MHTYIVKTCDTLAYSSDALEQYDAYHHNHDDDVPEGIVLNVQPIPPDDSDLDDLPF